MSRLKWRPLGGHIKAPTDFFDIRNQSIIGLNRTPPFHPVKGPNSIYLLLLYIPKRKLQKCLNSTVFLRHVYVFYMLCLRLFKLCLDAARQRTVILVVVIFRIWSSFQPLCWMEGCAIKQQISASEKSYFEKPNAR